MVGSNELRRRRALSIAALSALAGVAPKTVNDVERGLVVPKFRTVRRLSEALGVEPADVTEFAHALGLVPENANGAETGRRRAHGAPRRARRTRRAHRRGGLGDDQAARPQRGHHQGTEGWPMGGANQPARRQAQKVVLRQDAAGGAEKLRAGAPRSRVRHRPGRQAPNVGAIP